MSDQSRIGEPTTPHNGKSDPTALTTDALQREIAQLRELFDNKLKRVEDLTHHDIAAFERHLAFLESQRVELKNDVKDILKDALIAQEKTRDAALAAQKEAVSKAEVAAEKRSEGLSEKVDALAKTLGDRIDANAKLMTDVVGSLQLSRAGTEGQRVGGKEAITERRDNNAAIYGLAGFILVLLTIGSLIFAAIK